MIQKTENKFHPVHRTIHWILAGGMLLAFLTGFLRMTWMDKKHVAGIIEGVNSTIGSEEAIKMAKAIREPMWQWHVYAAYIIFFAFAARLIYMAIKGIRFPNPFNSKNPLKDRFQGSVYILFYIFAGINVVTGFYMKFIDGPLKKDFETIHKWALYWFPIFIILHFGGIWLGERTNKKGVVSKMIGGE